MKKSFFALLLALILALGGVLPVLAETTELEPVTLKVWMAGNKQKDSDVVWEEFNRRLADYLPNTTVEFLATPYGEYKEKWTKAMAAQEVFDVAWFSWNQSIADEVEMGSLTPLKALIDEYGQDLKTDLGEAALNAHTYAGDIYVIPCWQGLIGTQNGAFFPQMVLDKTGLQTFPEEFAALVQEVNNDYTIDSMAKLYDKVDEYLSAAKANDCLNGGYYEIVTGSLGAFSQTRRNLGNLGYLLWGDDSFTIRSEYITGSEAAEIELYAIKRLNEYWNAGYFREDLVSADYAGYSNAYPVEQCSVCYAHNYWNKAEIIRYTDENSYHGFAEVAIPFDREATFGTGYATATVIPYTSKNPERAMMYINLLNSAKGADLFNLLVYGLEGVHWEENGDGTINRISGFRADDPYGFEAWAVGNCYYARVTTGQALDQWNAKKELEQTALFDPIAAFTFVKTDVDAQFTNCRAIIGEYKYLFTLDYEEAVAKVEERNAKMMAAGLQDVLDEYERQLAAYLELNGITGWPEH